jgi:periplasmic protein TonB
MFDRYVEERRKPSWYRRSLIGASIVTHSVVGLFLFAMTLFSVDEIRPPALAIVFLKAPPPPPPLPPAFGKKRDTPKPQPVVKPRVRPPTPKVIVQPQREKPPEVKPPPPKEEEEVEEEGDPEGVVGGSKMGEKGGTLQGVEGGIQGPTGGVGAGLPTAAPPPKPKLVASFVFDRERLKYPDPHLPESFLQSHPAQTVKGMYRIFVDTHGSVSKVETVTSLSGADQTIIEQVKSTWQYKPQPVPVCTIRVFEFRIN